MYKTFMLIMLPLLGIAWLVYYLWQRHQDQLEKSQPKQSSQHLEKTRTEVSDWAKKMAAYKPPKRPSDSTPDQDGTPS